MKDEQIIHLFFQRSQEALSELQARYGAHCAAVARRVLGDQRDVEECVNDTWIRVWNAIPPDHPQFLGAYVARVVRNLALDRYHYNTAARRSSALTQAFEELEPCLLAKDDVVSQMEEKEFREFMDKFLGELSKENRSCFVRRYWYGESVREIGQAMRLSEGAVKSSLFRTRNRLLAAMEKEGVQI